MFFERKIISLKDALDVINYMIKYVEDNKERYWQHGGFAVVDYSGCLIAYAKMDGADVLAERMAIRKARTAALWGFPTSELRKLVKETNNDMLSWGTDFSIAMGGEPVIPPGIKHEYDSDAFPYVVGALGVSHVGVGIPDEEVALKGIEFLQERLWPSGKSEEV